MKVRYIILLPLFFIQWALAQVAPNCERIQEQHEIAVNKSQSKQYSEAIADFYNKVILPLSTCKCCDPLLLKEAYYYSGMSRKALGSNKGAVRDFENALAVDIQQDEFTDKINQKIEKALQQINIRSSLSAVSQQKSYEKQTGHSKEETILNIGWLHPQLNQLLANTWVIDTPQQQVTINVFSNKIIQKEWIQIFINGHPYSCKFIQKTKIKHAPVNDITYKKYTFQTSISFKEGIQQLQAKIQIDNFKTAVTEPLSVFYNQTSASVQHTIPILSIEPISTSSNTIAQNQFPLSFKIISEVELSKEYCKLYINSKISTQTGSFREIIAEGNLPEYIYEQKVPIQDTPQEAYLMLYLPDGTTKKSDLITIP